MVDSSSVESIGLEGCLIGVIGGFGGSVSQRVDVEAEGSSGIHCTGEICRDGSGGSGRGATIAI
jgi:hypothetical protein